MSALVLGLIMTVGGVCANDQSPEVELSIQLGRIHTWLQSNQVANLMASGEPLLVDQLGTAQLLADEAVSALNQGHLLLASSTYSEALMIFGWAMAEYIEPEVARVTKRRNEDLRQQINTYRIGIENFGPHQSRTYRPETLNRLMLDADRLSHMGAYQLESQLLQEAYVMVVSTVSELRDKQTVVHELEFATPAAKLEYERRVYDDYYQLVAQIMGSGEIAAERQDPFAQAVGEGERAFQLALEYERSGDLSGAARILESATDYLKRALRASGVRGLF